MSPVANLIRATKPGAFEADSDLGAKLLRYSTDIGSLRTPEAVLSELHAITSPALGLNVLGAGRFPLVVSDWEAICRGKNLFLHESVPSGFWDEWIRRAPDHNPLLYFMARMSLAPHTWSEMLRQLAPVGADRWGIELAMKYGIRDGLMCPVGGRWLVCFWSSRVLTHVITEPRRIMILAAASFAAMRLDELVQSAAETEGAYTQLTPRELAVVRLLSWDKSHRDIAEALGLGEETVRTHLKNAKAKLGARSQTYAVAKALRQRLIP
jgi:DNA-binding CsgD family transcriptional regulator